MRVEEYMTRDPIVVSPEDSLLGARRQMRRHGIRHLLVEQENRLEGVITDRDVRDYMPSLCRDLQLHELRQDIETLRVDEVMRRLPVTVEPDDDIGRAAHLMLEHRIGCLPVVRGGEIVGVITTSDVLRAFSEHALGPGVSRPHPETDRENQAGA